MIKLLTGIIVCSFAALTGLSQSTALPLNEQRFGDSLQKILNSTMPDSMRANAGFLLSNFWYRKDSVKGAAYLEQGRILSKNNPFQQSIYFFYLGNLKSLNNLELSASSFMKADSLLQKFSTKEAFVFRSKVWHNYGAIQQMKDDNEYFADLLLEKAIPFAIKGGDSVYLGKNYFDLGLAFTNTLQFAKAEDVWQKAIQIFNRVNAPKEHLMDVYNLSAQNYIELKDMNRARAMLDSSAALLKPYPESQYYLDYYASQGMFFNAQGKFSLANESIDKGITLSKKLNQPYREQRILLQKFFALYGEKKFDKGKEVLLTLMNSQPFISLLVNRLQVYNGMAENYAGMGDHKAAYDWLRRYSQLNDSVANVNLKSRINALTEKYKARESQEQIAILKAENEKALLTSKNNRLLTWLFGLTSLFLLIIAALGWFYFRNHKRLQKQKELSYQQQLLEAEQKQEIQFARALLQGEEKERKRIASDLHDGLGGMLAGVKINLSKLAENPKSVNMLNTDINKVIDQLDGSVNELRRIARNMMPESLLQLGLEVSLKDMCDAVNTASTKVEFQAFSINAGLPKETQITIYRIVQELLANVIRHANASEILVQCSQNENTFYITLEDNGKGFDISTLPLQKGIGISNVKNRVEFLKGKMDIQSSPAQGTAVNIEFNIPA
ncbi:MAG: sensor histidine kinase [Chitinophagaceae bacterium]|nr:sensor histidine kinase [Chitinophagaceae bacterium]